VTVERRAPVTAELVARPEAPDKRGLVARHKRGEPQAQRRDRVVRAAKVERRVPTVEQARVAARALVEAGQAARVV